MATPFWWRSWDPYATQTSRDMWTELGSGADIDATKANPVVGAYVLNQLIPWLSPQEQAMAAAVIQASNANQYGFTGNYSVPTVGTPGIPSWDQTAQWLRGLGGMEQSLTEMTPFLSDQFGADSSYLQGLRGLSGLARQASAMPRTAQGMRPWEGLMNTQAGIVNNFDWLADTNLGTMFRNPQYRAPSFNISAPIASNRQMGAQQWW